MAPRAQPHSHSFGFPCGGVSIRALPFATTCRFALYILWRCVDSCPPSHGSAFGFCQPSDDSTLPYRSPSHSGYQAMDHATCGHPHQGHAFAPRLSSHRPSSYSQTMSHIRGLAESYVELASERSFTSTPKFPNFPSSFFKFVPSCLCSFCFVFHPHHQDYHEVMSFAII